ncbi:MAG: hypothetical protein DMG05_01005 [Acidobacteria bacterium]|nr:MAG: hypothetical protein DMG05_01005 [Acidobacteriota bacterium]
MHPFNPLRISSKQAQRHGFRLPTSSLVQVQDWLVWNEVRTLWSCSLFICEKIQDCGLRSAEALATSRCENGRAGETAWWNARSVARFSACREVAAEPILGDRKAPERGAKKIPGM